MDLRVVKLTDILTITNFEYTKLSTPSIMIVGPNLSSVDYVSINGIKSPSVIVLNSNKILAQVPESEVGKYLDVNAYSYNASNTRRNSKIDIGIGSIAGISSGQSYLVQRFIKLLLTESGSNAFNQDEGTDFIKISGIYSPRDENMIKGKISNAIRDVERFMRDTQDSITDPSSKLISATLLSVKWSEDRQSVSVSVSLLDENGNSTNISTGV
jgi:uncharacterized protein (UPF0254 family)